MNEQSKFLAKVSAAFALIVLVIALLTKFVFDDSVEPAVLSGQISKVADSVRQNAHAVFGENDKANGSAAPLYEAELLEIVELVKKGELSSALQRLDHHLSRYPKSRVGLLVKADILAAQAGDTPAQSLTSVATPINPAEGFDIEGLRSQIKNRWQHKQAHSMAGSNAMLPANLVYFGQSEYALVADMQNARLYVYQNGKGIPRLVKDYYLTVGSQGYGKQVEGDNKTPVGVYVVNNFLKPENLPDLYGSGAFPVNYPNILDRAKDRTGYGIWLHGTPSDTYARSPWASEGCFVVSNEDFEDIQRYIDVKKRTPVVLADSVQWLDEKQFSEQQESYLALVETWRKTWESLDTQAYLDYYSRDQFNFGLDEFEPWAARKRIVNASKTFVQVQLELKSLFVYPGEQDTFVVSYRQHYLSNNYSGLSDKQQFWQKDAQGQWRIIFEG